MHALGAVAQEETELDVQASGKLLEMQQMPFVQKLHALKE